MFASFNDFLCDNVVCIGNGIMLKYVCHYRWYLIGKSSTCSHWISKRVEMKGHGATDN